MFEIFVTFVSNCQQESLKLLALPLEPTKFEVNNVKSKIQAGQNQDLRSKKVLIRCSNVFLIFINFDFIFYYQNRTFELICRTSGM